MKTKMTKKPLKKAQTGTTVGAEQGKGAKLLRTAGIATPIIGAIGMGIKALKDRKKKKQEAYISAKKDKKKTGGMVNPNAKASASTTATGYSGGISSAPKTALPKAQKGKAVNTYTPFQNYMKTPGAMASDTTQSFTGSRDGSNPVLDKAYYDTYYAGQENKRRTGSDKVKYDAEGKRVYKTGGMVNSNAKVSSLKSAGSKGVKSGVNPKASASKKATGRSGGTSTAPKTALPKAQYGRAISEKAANRKVSKGKGTIAKPYPSGPDEKGSYVGFSKEARRSDSPFVSMKNSKAPRPIQKKGGAVKKQMGGNAGSYTPPNQPGGKPTAGGYTAPKGTGLNSAPGKRQIKRDFKKMIRNQSKNG